MRSLPLGVLTFLVASTGAAMAQTETPKQLAETLAATAPTGASSGEWMQTIELAGVSSCKGGFIDPNGEYISSADESGVFSAIRHAIDDIHSTGDQSWNTARIKWHAGDAVATIEIFFDPDIVPRDVDDPVIEQAATARREFWDSLGKTATGYLGSSTKRNNYGQTNWISPHRRLLRVEMNNRATLVTDGLSTPWTGVPDKRNGSGAEIFLEVPRPGSPVEPWIDILLDIGDSFAEYPGVERDVLANEAILFFDLPDTVVPYSHIVLSIPADDEPKRIPSLPFGSVNLLKATAVTRDDLNGYSLNGWAVDASRQALRRRLARKSEE